MAPRPPRFIWLLVLLALLFSLFSVVVLGAAPTTSARSHALYEPRGRTFLAASNADLPLSMASTTKIMTALVALESGALDRTVVIPKEAVGIEGSSLYLKEGEVLTLEELLLGLMLRSANDAACAIAIACEGSVEAFVDRMNARAEELGLLHTHFENPHGLDAEGHQTTARELAILAAEAMNNDVFRTIVSTRRARIGEGEDVRLLTNHNKLLTLYEGAVGVKTGYTRRCGRCLVGAAERDGALLVSVTIDAPDDWDDHCRLLDYGFSLVTGYTVEAGAYTYEVPVLDAAPSATVRVSNPESLSLVLPKPCEVTAEVRLCRYTVAPVRRGDRLGAVLLTKDGELLAELPLVATEDVLAVRTKRRFLF